MPLISINVRCDCCRVSRQKKEGSITFGTHKHLLNKNKYSLTSLYKEQVGSILSLEDKNHALNQEQGRGIFVYNDGIKVSIFL